MTGTKPRFCSEGNRGVCGYHQDQDHPGWVFVITIIYLSFTEACWKCYCALSAARASIQVGSEWMPYFRLPAAAVGQLLRAKGAPDSGCLGVKIIQPWGYIPTLDNVCGNQKHPIDGPPNQQGLVETSFWSQLVWPIPWFRDEDSTLWLSSTKPRARWIRKSPTVIVIILSSPAVLPPTQQFGACGLSLLPLLRKSFDTFSDLEDREGLSSFAYLRVFLSKEFDMAVKRMKPLSYTLVATRCQDCKWGNYIIIIIIHNNMHNINVGYLVIIMLVLTYVNIIVSPKLSRFVADEISPWAWVWVEHFPRKAPGWQGAQQMGDLDLHQGPFTKIQKSSAKREFSAELPVMRWSRPPIPRRNRPTPRPPWVAG